MHRGQRPVPPEELTPHGHVSIFHVREATEYVLPHGVWLDGGERAIQKRSIGFILPMLAKGS